MEHVFEIKIPCVFRPARGFIGGIHPGQALSDDRERAAVSRAIRTPGGVLEFLPALDGPDHCGVARATAEIAGQGFLDFLLRGILVALDQGVRTEDHP